MKSLFDKHKRNPFSFFKCSFLSMRWVFINSRGGPISSYVCRKNLTVAYWRTAVFRFIRSTQCCPFYRRNAGHAGMCNFIGYAISQFLGYVLFIILESKEFCNIIRRIPQDHGFVSFSSIYFFPLLSSFFSSL